MRTISTPVFLISELSEEATIKAYNAWLSTEYYPYSCDNEATLRKFEEIFPIKVCEWEYGQGRNHISMSFLGGEDIGKLYGRRLAKYIWNNYRDQIYSRKVYWNGRPHSASRYSKIIMTQDCPLTGYYLDTVILQPLYDVMEKPNEFIHIDFYDLMQLCLEKWAVECGEDCDNYFSYGNFIEQAKDNNWEYFEDGTQYS
jgi:hypothetical protein